MIYGKIWLVVKPTVGIPLFLGAVAVSSFAVHYMLLTHTTWVPKFLEGGAQKMAAVAAPETTAAAPPTALVAAAPAIKSQ
ncbi:MAG: light-harvesting protein [Rubrivivax sp.]|nr:light-harvesting protein [Rubrivivax sp.]MDH5338904.1 light-harvesting protein [Rubrivivax sp.]